jgi:hypothetical protein
MADRQGGPASSTPESTAMSGRPRGPYMDDRERSFADRQLCTGDNPEQPMPGSDEHQ